MLFAHDTVVALRSAAALVNTGPETSPDEDALTTPAELAAFYTDWKWTGRLDADESELRAVREFRSALYAIWLAAKDPTRTVALVNDMLRAGRALPQLVTHDDFGWHIHATAPDAPLAERMQCEAGMAFVDVIRVEELSRLRICQATDCTNVLVDLSRNRSKRYCEGGCGNRLAAAAYRSRRG